MPGKVLPDAVVDRLMKDGLSDGAIARHLLAHHQIKVTRQAISVWRKRQGDRVQPQSPRAMPWTLREEHRQTEPARLIRWHARVERGETLRPMDQARYERGVAELRKKNAVIHYDPDVPGGWRLVPRRKGIDKGLVREPDEVATG